MQLLHLDLILCSPATRHHRLLAGTKLYCLLTAHVPLSPSSIIWYQPIDDDALWLDYTVLSQGVVDAA